LLLLHRRQRERMMMTFGVISCQLFFISSFL
jgi:hypothetical protein